MNGRLVGILTNRDVRFATNERQKISELMTHEGLVTVTDGVGKDEAKTLLHRHRIEKLLVVDDEGNCIGLSPYGDEPNAIALDHRPPAAFRCDCDEAKSLPPCRRHRAR